MHFAEFDGASATGIERPQESRKNFTKIWQVASANLIMPAAAPQKSLQKNVRLTPGASSYL
jgi:hypothetical protein